MSNDVKVTYDHFMANGPSWELSKLVDHLGREENMTIERMISGLTSFSTFEIWRDWIMSFIISPPQHFIFIHSKNEELYHHLVPMFPAIGFFPDILMPLAN